MFVLIELWDMLLYVRPGGQESDFLIGFHIIRIMRIYVLRLFSAVYLTTPTMC